MIAVIAIQMPATAQKSHCERARCSAVAWTMCAHGRECVQSVDGCVWYVGVRVECGSMRAASVRVLSARKCVFGVRV